MIVLACEGKCEVKLLTKLIENNCLVFDIKNILDRRPLHIRQPQSITPLINILPIEEDIIFYRIGDTQNDDFDLSCFGDIRKAHIVVKKICTKPEIEILIIISEGLFEEYNKHKSKMMPKQFVKSFVRDYIDFEHYIDSHDISYAIKEYKRIKNHKKDEFYLADLLK